jgi:hypothetical protein
MYRFLEGLTYLIEVVGVLSGLYPHSYLAMGKGMRKVVKRVVEAEIGRERGRSRGWPWLHGERGEGNAEREGARGKEKRGKSKRIRGGGRGKQPLS